jgi:hypothetical protein
MKGVWNINRAYQALGGAKKGARDYSTANSKHGDSQQGVEQPPLEMNSATSAKCSPLVSQESLSRAQATQDIYLIGIIETLVQKYSENSTKGPLSLLERMLREF